ncbi:MAG: acyl-CoA thioester hydrolase/BAAT C-terminal domain-containing protein [Tissierellia bacterium]|nr:acyl-CoA thioester hydrolase/BAAT C-terminal domain-containing protein [Tissierellia bacterium]
MGTFKKILIYLFFMLILVTLIILALRKYHHKKIESVTSKDYSAENYNYPQGIDRTHPEKSQIPGVNVSVIEDGKAVGYKLDPYHKISKGAIITLGGSEGSSNFPLAAQLAKEGYVVYSMYYFGKDNLPKELVKVPVENLKAILEKVKGEVDGPISVIGASKGAEFALLASTIYPDAIDHLVLYSPSSHVFQGLSSNRKVSSSSFSFQEEEISYLSFKDVSPSIWIHFLIQTTIGKPLVFEPLYHNLLDNTKHFEETRIKVEKFPGDILIFVGEKDQMWPSLKMAKFIKKNHPHTKIKTFHDAGHTFYGPGILDHFALGGNSTTNQRAKIISDTILYHNLEHWHPLIESSKN